MNTAIVIAGLMLGFASGGHCALMCGAGSAACAASPAQPWRHLAGFHLGRLGGYVIAGGTLAVAGGLLRDLMEGVAALRPLWTMLNVALFMLGITLLVTARQPGFFAALTQRFSGSNVAVEPRPIVFRQRDGSALAGKVSRRGFLVGAAWAFVPCGALYSLWALALLAGNLASGAATAAAFAVASGAQLAFVQWWFLRSRRSGQGQEAGRWNRIGLRTAGAALCVSAALSLSSLFSQHGAAGLFCL